MRKTVLSGFCIGLLFTASLTLNAQEWHALILQKTKAAQTIETIKANVLPSKTSAIANTYTKQQRQEKNKFFKTVRQFYPQPQSQNQIIDNYNHISAVLRNTPVLKNYALTVQHPADLYSITPKEMSLLENILLSFKNPQKNTAYTPAQMLQFPSGAILLSFKPEEGKEIHFAFKPQENILKIAVGDFPISQQEFGPFPAEIYDK